MRIRLARSCPMGQVEFSIWSTAVAGWGSRVGEQRPDSRQRPEVEPTEVGDRAVEREAAAVAAALSDALSGLEVLCAVRFVAHARARLTQTLCGAERRTTCEVLGADRAERSRVAGR